MIDTAHDITQLPPDVADSIAAYELAYRHPSDFMQQAWNVIEPGTPYRHNWHIDCIGEYLEAVYRGDILRLIINIPPRYLKSTAVTICWPVWCWLHNPSWRFLFASYSGDLSAEHSAKRRDLIQSDWFQEGWGDRFTLTKTQEAKLYNSHKGEMIASSVGGTSIGRGGECLIFDDPMNPQEAFSDAERATANRWIRASFLTRANDPKTTRIVGVMQRLHEEDTTGMLLSLGGWEHLNIPYEAEQRTVIHFPISGRELVREAGSLMFPEREGAEEIARRKIELGSYGYAGQYQQRPSPPEGGMIKRDWFRYWGYHNLPNAFDEIIQSWDTAMTKDSGDRTSGGVWGRKGANIYLMERVAGQWDTPTVIGKIKWMSTRYPDALSKLVEKKANGAAIIDLLRDELAGIIPIEPRGSKEARVHAVLPLLEAGNVYLPAKEIAPWVDEYIEELCGFPTRAHDDDVDMTTMALDRLRPAARTAEEDAKTALPEEESVWRTMMARKSEGTGKVHSGW